MSHALCYILATSHGKTTIFPGANGTNLAVELDVEFLNKWTISSYKKYTGTKKMKFPSGLFSIQIVDKIARDPVGVFTPSRGAPR